MDSEIKSVSHRHAALQEYPGFIMGSDLMFTALWGKNQGRRGAAVEEFPSVTAVGNDWVHSADPSGYEPHCQQTNRGKKKVLFRYKHAHMCLVCTAWKQITWLGNLQIGSSHQSSQQDIWPSCCFHHGSVGGSSQSQPYWHKTSEKGRWRIRCVSDQLMTFSSVKVVCTLRSRNSTTTVASYSCWIWADEEQSDNFPKIQLKLKWHWRTGHDVQMNIFVYIYACLCFYIL